MRSSGFLACGLLFLSAGLPMYGQTVTANAAAGEEHTQRAMRTERPVRPVVTAEVIVHPGDGGELSSEGYERTFTMEMVEMSAGTFGDPSRYVQTLAGVVSDNDQRNDFLVRGGNPAENGFVVDNIEVPSINQLALSDTTGGLVSMLDAAAIQSMTLHTDAYASRFDERLSSVFEITTLPAGAVEPRTETELGVGGMGANATRRIAGANVFVSARQSVMQYVTNDIGMNGVPRYRNAFVRADRQFGERNSVWGMSLTGSDSISIHPNPADLLETNPYDVHYKGLRNTTGVNWQHMFSDRMFGVASLAQSVQSQSVVENAQLQNEVAIYNEQTSDNMTTGKYDWSFALSKWLAVSAGGRGSLDRLNYSVAQLYGLPNPYSLSPEAADSGTFTAKFGTGSSAGYGEATVRLPRDLQLVLGVREEQWALGGHKGTTGKLLVSKSIRGHAVHAGFAEYEQLPEKLYMLTMQNLRTLKPIHSRQFTAGATLADNTRARVMLEGYEKLYGDYPVATEYPELSMANIADSFGQAFLMFPMVGAGKGTARGAELTAEMHVTAKLDLTGTLAYERSWYAGLDGVLRKSNYDLPMVSNLTGTWRLGHGLALSWRYSVTSGRPYTPILLPVAEAQNRLVYDTTQINAMRSAMYQRLDFRLTGERRMGRGMMTWHAGLQNAMNNHNFYAQVWEPRWVVAGGSQVDVQNQMPIFPDGDVKYRF